MMFESRLLKLILTLVPVLMTGCMDYGPTQKETIGTAAGRGLFVLNEGNFTYGNASLSYYDPAAGTVENEVFVRTNGFKLGDVGQSMTIHDGRGYIAVNNSGIVFVIDPYTFEYIGEIAGLSSPRYVHIVSPEKGYITDLYDPSITVFDPRTLTVTGHIPTDFEGRTQPSTEQMVQRGTLVFTNCWSYDDRLLVIDTLTDRVIDQFTVGRQPTSLVIDRHGKLWTVTDGGYPGSSFGNEDGRLFRIDTDTRRIESEFTLPEGKGGTNLCTDAAGGNIYFISGHVWKMDVQADTFPAEPFIRNETTNNWFSLAVDPVTGEIYVGDAIDYAQGGMVYRYSPEVELKESFRVGISPGAFCFREGRDG